MKDRKDSNGKIRYDKDFNIRRQQEQQLGKNMTLDKATIKAFKSNGIRAKYHGLPALVLPVDSELAKKINQGMRMETAVPGEFIVVADHYDMGKPFSGHDGTFHGKRFDVNQFCDLGFKIPRRDGPFMHISGATISELTVALLQARNTVLEDVQKTGQENQSAGIRWKYARSKGENVPKPEIRQTEFDTSSVDVFKKLEHLVRTVEERQNAILEDPTIGQDIKADATEFLMTLRSQRNNTPSEFEEKRINEEDKLRRRIATLDPDHPEAARIPSHEKLDALRKVVEELEDRFSAHRTLDQEAREKFDSIHETPDQKVQIGPDEAQDILAAMKSPFPLKSRSPQNRNESTLPSHGM